MFDFLTHTFMVNALLIALMIGISGALLSPFLALNNQAMIADGLSHVAFSSIILSLILAGQPFYLSIPFIVLGSVLITYISEKKSINSDAAIAIVSSLSLAIGLIIISVVSGFNYSVESFLIGSILTITKTDLIYTLIVMIIILLFIISFYRLLLSTTFDQVFARFQIKKYRLTKYLLSVITSLFIIVSIQSVGMLLTSSLIVFPAIISSQFSKSFKAVLIGGLITAIINVFISITISYHLNLPTASTIVLGYGFILVGAILVNKYILKYNK